MFEGAESVRKKTTRRALACARTGRQRTGARGAPTRQEGSYFVERGDHIRHHQCCSFLFFKQKTAYEMAQCDWSSDVCSSDLDDVESAWRETTSRGAVSVLEPT